MYRDLIPLLATRYRVIAPDLPGVGFTDVPAERNYVYSVHRLADTMDAFVQALDLKSYALYVFDYGAPVGLRLETYHLDLALMERPGNREIQLDLFLDYANNLAQYPAFQQFFRGYAPPTLVVWASTTPSLSRPAPPLLRATIRMPGSPCWTRATSRWKPTSTRSPQPSAC